MHKVTCIYCARDGRCQHPDRVINFWFMRFFRLCPIPVHDECRWQKIHPRPAPTPANPPRREWTGIDPVLKIGFEQGLWVANKKRLEEYAPIGSLVECLGVITTVTSHDHPKRYEAGLVLQWMDTQKHLQSVFIGVEDINLVKPVKTV